jgi:nitroimidazol reductase NimA-like FMN-containing flavoprotein (pyridoxamine 5'-phosphate oxidase superfamily)
MYTGTRRSTPEIRFSEITPERCMALLQTHTVGRVAWQAADGPQILPVTYACLDRRIVFRTSPYGILSELIRPTDVGFEVDDLDQQEQTGWSVVLRGRAQAVAQPEDLVRLWTIHGLVPWASGVRNLFIRIEPQRVSGRLVATGPG